MGDVVLVLSPPGAVDAKGNLRNSFPVSSLSALGGLSGGLNGLNLSFTSTHEVTVSKGSASIENGAGYYNATLGAPAVADLDAKGAGGLDAGAKAPDTWYYVWLLANPTTAAVGVMLSASATAPTLPAGYTLRRRLGSVKTGPAAGAPILDFLQTGSGPNKAYQCGPDLSGAPMLTAGTTNGAVALAPGASPQASTVTVVPTYKGAVGSGFILQSKPGFVFGAVTATAGGLTAQYGALTGLAVAGEIYYTVQGVGELTLNGAGWTESL